MTIRRTSHSGELHGTSAKPQAPAAIPTLPPAYSVIGDRPFPKRVRLCVVRHGPREVDLPFRRLLAQRTNLANAAIIPVRTDGLIPSRSRRTVMIVDIMIFRARKRLLATLVLFYLDSLPHRDTPCTLPLAASYRAGNPRDIPIPLSACGIPPSRGVFVSTCPQSHRTAELPDSWPAGQTQPLVSHIEFAECTVANAAIGPSRTNGRQ